MAEPQLQRHCAGQRLGYMTCRNIPRFSLSFFFSLLLLISFSVLLFFFCFLLVTFFSYKYRYHSFPVLIAWQSCSYSVALRDMDGTACIM